MPWDGSRRRRKDSHGTLLAWAARSGLRCRRAAFVVSAIQFASPADAARQSGQPVASGRSDQDQCVPRRKFAATQSGVGGCIVDRQVGRHQCGGSPQCAPIGARIRQNDEQTVDVGIRAFLVDPAHLTLRVNEACLELRPTNTMLWIGQRQVPCALISSISDRDLTPDAQGRSDKFSERLCKSQVRQISKGFTTGIRPDPEIDANDARDPIQRSETDPPSQATLDAAELRCGDPDGVRDLIQRQPRRGPRDAKLGAHVRSNYGGTAVGPGDTRLRHRAIVKTVAHPPLISWSTPSGAHR